MTTNILPAEPRVVFDHVSKTYTTGHAHVKVVADVSFSLAEKDFVSLIGPSGCGKTTMLQMLAGFVQPEGPINDTKSFSAKEKETSATTFTCACPVV